MVCPGGWVGSVLGELITMKEQIKEQEWVPPLLALMVSPAGLADNVEALAKQMASDLPPIGHAFPEEKHPKVRRRVRALIRNTEIFQLLLMLPQCRGMTLTQAVSASVPHLEGDDVSEEEQEERDRLFKNTRSRMIRAETGTIPLLKGFYPLIHTCYYRELDDTKGVMWCRSYLKGDTKSGGRRDRERPRKDELVLMSTILLNEIIANLKPHYRKLSENLFRALRD